MDDKNNEIIDFSNQPLGLMAQEGEKIEKSVVNNANSPTPKPTLPPNVQDNPFADITPVNNNQPQEEKPAVEPTPQPVIQPEEKPQPEEPVQPVVESSPVVEQPVENSPVVNNQLDNSNPPTEEERKQQLIDDLNKSVPPPVKDDTSSAGVIAFLVLIAIVVAAVIFFKNGKLDEILDSDKEETKTEEKALKEDTQEEKKPEEEQPETPAELEPVKNYKIRETHYLADDKVNIYITFEGNVDQAHKKGDIIYTLMLNGRKSKNIHQYIDYDKGIAYYEINDGKTKTWYKEKGDFAYSIDEILKKFEALKAEDLGNGNYVVNLNSKTVKEFVNTSEYVDLKKANNSNVKIEYTMAEGRLAKYKINLTGVIKLFKECIVLREYSNYNQAGDVTIPDNVIKVAKEYKS